MKQRKCLNRCPGRDYRLHWGTVKTNKLVLEPGAMTILCIGAHPDDCEFRCSGAASLFARRGDNVVIASVTDGRSGHHDMTAEEVAATRMKEAADAASVIGAASRILGAPDGALEPNLEMRWKIIRLVREVKPDIVITNRPNDYHPDHRYTALLVQDSAYMFMVPHVVPEAEPLEYNPIILYWMDNFQYPRAFKPDVVVDIDEVLDTKIAILHAHTSQVYEWLPWVERNGDTPPQDPAARIAWLRRYYMDRTASLVETIRGELKDRYGDERGAAIGAAEAFEICEYGTRPSREDLEHVFEGL